MLPATLNPRPPYFPLVPLAAAVATLLSASVLNAASAVGLPRFELPVLMGGVFASDLGWAIGVGYFVYFLIGVLFAPLPVLIWWPNFPGPPETFRGALVRAVIWGVVYWIFNGLIVVSIIGALDKLPPSTPAIPGFFALQLGIGGALVLFIANLLWGIGFCLVAMMGQGISPLDTLGWAGYDMAMGQHDIRRSARTHTPGR